MTKSLIILAALIVAMGTKSQAADMVGNDLITYFSSTCRTQGEYTKQALNDAQSLISILENIKSDPDCSTIAGGIGQLSNLQNKLSELEQQGSLQIEVEKLTAQENELLLQLSDTNEEYVKQEIETSIRQIQIYKASYVAEIAAKKELQASNVKDLYTKIVSSTNSLFKTISSNHRCLDKNPNLLPAATSLTGAIAAASTSINPALGIGISAATDFIGHTIESFRVGKYNKMIREISDSGMALEGYKCVLESLSERWCSLEDARGFLELKASVRRETNYESGLRSAFRLNDRDVPVLLDWLNKVKTGVPASTTADAQRQITVYQREAAVRSAESLGSGVISQNRPLFDSLETAQDKYTVVKQVISSLTGVSCGGVFTSSEGGSNPMSDIYSSGYAPFYLLGLDEIPRLNGFGISFCDFDPFTQWPNGGAYTPDLTEVKGRYTDWIDKARQRVNQELTLVLQPDALQVLTLAYEDTSNKWKHSPLASISNLADFLINHMPESFASDSFQRLYSSTVSKLLEIRDIIEGGVIGDAYPDPKTALEDIFKSAELQYGVIILQSRLEMILRISIKEYLDSLDHDGSNEAAQLLAAESFVDVLSRISGTDNLALIAADIKRARPIAIGNMISFLDVFGENINRILEKNYNLINRVNDPILGEVYQRNASEICLLLSSMPSWPESVEKKYCVGSVLEEVLPGGPRSKLITKDYLDQNFGARNCGYRNYIRKSKIYQEWGIQL